MTEKDEIRERITATANEKFKKYGIRRVTMDDIARAMRMSKKTLYKHFSSKRELVRLLELRSARQRHDAVRDALSGAASPREGFAAGFLAIQRLLRETSPQLMSDISLDYPDIWAELEAVRLEIIQMFATCLSESAARGELRPGVVPEVAAGIMQTVVNKYMVQEKFREARVSRRAAVTTWFIMLSAGLFNDPPLLDCNDPDLPAD